MYATDVDPEESARNETPGKKRAMARPCFRRRTSAISRIAKEAEWFLILLWPNLGVSSMQIDNQAELFIQGRWTAGPAPESGKASAPPKR